MSINTTNNQYMVASAQGLPVLPNVSQEESCLAGRPLLAFSRTEVDGSKHFYLKIASSLWHSQKQQKEYPELQSSFKRAKKEHKSSLSTEAVSSAVRVAPIGSIGTGVGSEFSISAPRDESSLETFQEEICAEEKRSIEPSDKVDTMETPWLSWLEWGDTMDRLRILPSHVEALEGLKKICAYDKASESYLLWVTLSEEKEQYLKLVLEVGRSNFISHTCTQEALGEAGQRYTYLRAYEYLSEEGAESVEKPLLEMRINSVGYLGELIWIQGGKSGIAGSTLLDFSTQIQDSLRVSRVLLNDDCKKKNLSLRYWLPLATDTLATWYQKRAGYRVLECEGLQSSLDAKVFYSQSVLKYESSLTYVKELDLAHLWSLFKGFTKDTLFLRGLMKKYLKVQSPTMLIARDFSIHDLLQEIHRESISGEGRQAAFEDAEKFCAKFLKAFKVTEKRSQELKAFAEALKEIEFVRVFCRDLVWV
jgi:hypothetical protein